MNSSRHSARPGLAFALTLSTFLLPGLAHATVWQVPGDMSGTCTIAVPSCDTIAAALAEAASGDEVQIGAGTFSEGNLAVPAGVTVSGAGIGTTIVSPGGLHGFTVSTADVTLRDLSVQGAANGISVNGASGLTVERVAATLGTSGMVIAGVTSNTRVDASNFSSNTSSGIRMASTSTVSGLEVTDSNFNENRLGIYQANDGSTSSLTGLEVSGCSFSHNGSTGGDAAIYAEEIVNSTIENNTFTYNFRGILIFKGYSTNPAAVANVRIEDNQFTDQVHQSIYVIPQAVGAGEDIVISGNTISQDVGLLSANPAPIELRMRSSLTHESIEIAGNTVTFTGEFDGPATAAHALMMRGNGPVVVQGNVFDGGGVVGSTDAPRTSAIYIRSQDSLANFAQIPATAEFTISCNRIEGFENGVSVYSVTGGAYGGLLDGTTVTIVGNAIEGSATGFGVRTGADPTAIDAAGNYWGCETGPGTMGCADADGNVDTDPFEEFFPACVDCLQDSECSDGVACNGAETCNVGTGMCEAGAPVDCDDGNECTIDACEEPTGDCAYTNEVDGTSCEDGLTCSIEPVCDGGLCLGGTDDNSDLICDEDQSASLISAAMKGQKPGKANGKVGARAVIETSPPGDLLDASSEITLRVEDVDAAGAEHTFDPSHCKTKGGGKKIVCLSPDKSAKLSFKAIKNLPGAFQMKGRIKGLSIDGPFPTPLRSVLTYGPGTERIGEQDLCKVKPRISKCKE